jgi:large subunit ribosomal protein L6
MSTTFIKIPINIKIQILKNYIKIISPSGIFIKKKNTNLKFLIYKNKLFLLKSDKKGIYFFSLLSKYMLALSKGCYKTLIIEGVGYKMFIEKKQLIFKLGFSHQVIYNIPDDIEVFWKNPNFIIVYGTNFQKVSQICAEIRALKPPEPYKGKVIRYLNEIIIKKKGKTD